MTNIKKIGLTALAASLVSTSAYAGAITVNGGASLGITGMSGEKMNRATTYSMGDNLTFTGGGSLENGLNVAISMEIDQGDAAGSTSPFEAQSLTLSRDDLGTLVFAGADGSSAGSSISKTAAGNIWDQFDGLVSGTGSTGVARLQGGATTNSFFYTTPALVEGLNLFASFNPTTATKESYTGYGVTYSGIAGLSASYANQTVEGGTTATNGDDKIMKLSYAFGPVTVAASDKKYKAGTGVGVGGSGSNEGQDIRSYNIAYTVSEALSVGYGMETITSGLSSEEDAEYSKISGSYTVGGMSLSAYMSDAENINHDDSVSTEDQEKWGLGASFAF